jgi:hypothetical protein
MVAAILQKESPLGSFMYQLLRLNYRSFSVVLYPWQPNKYML